MPDVPDHLAWLWRAWHRLDIDRAWIAGGMGAAMPLRIGWQTIIAWADFHDCDETAYQMLEACLTAMDSVFLASHSKRVSALSAKG